MCHGVPMKTIRPSLPVRGAWIEIGMTAEEFKNLCRSPCRERGLKYDQMVANAGTEMSLPVQGAWIEIPPSARFGSRARVAPRAGSVD